MGRTLTVFVMMLPTIAIGFGVPAASMFWLRSSTVAAIVSGVAIFFALILGFITVVDGLGHLPPELDKGERKELSLLRAHQRATLEEFDDIAAILREIRDILKAVEKRA